jgi:hypothetical protein
MTPKQHRCNLLHKHFSYYHYLHCVRVLTVEVKVHWLLLRSSLFAASKYTGRQEWLLVSDPANVLLKIQAKIFRTPLKPPLN